VTALEAVARRRRIDSLGKRRGNLAHGCEVTSPSRISARRYDPPR
jgi:hypothetical protein